MNSHIRIELCLCTPRIRNLEAGVASAAKVSGPVHGRGYDLQMTIHLHTKQKNESEEIPSPSKSATGETERLNEPIPTR
ncbi:hypothetical protein BWQ96_05467 [Gracilariopsis chorda]|uniref:Uncharacterized protein n=1 Tax=Gracilariopsis chorda TaxID=448386 RepID=A0A2V3ISS1_9FLOR|nr:hypothetical protein BWQ96_05467 [Gracilariopsis chorda]|eukprot:PXF44797.1 hypothetical protein BWQ96_05467 [Gracilariopsis chorda]